jgi:hypothetical protein
MTYIHVYIHNNATYRISPRKALIGYTRIHQIHTEHQHCKPCLSRGLLFSPWLVISGWGALRIKKSRRVTVTVALSLPSPSPDSPDSLLFPFFSPHNQSITRSCPLLNAPHPLRGHHSPVRPSLPVVRSISTPPPPAHASTSLPASPPTTSPR